MVNGMQTNLYRISDEQIALLKAEKIELGVSCDVVGGVRLSLGNRETEEQDRAQHGSGARGRRRFWRDHRAWRAHGASHYRHLRFLSDR